MIRQMATSTLFILAASSGFAAPYCGSEAESAATAIEKINGSKEPSLSIPVEEVSVDSPNERLRYEVSFDYNTYSVLTNFKCRILEVFSLNEPQ